jgi:glycerol uptake facilitator-like aquaporin
MVSSGKWVEGMMPISEVVVNIVNQFFAPYYPDSMLVVMAAKPYVKAHRL